MKSANILLLMLLEVTRLFETTLASAYGDVLSYRTTEESDVNTFVGNVARDSELYKSFTQNDFQALRYAISTKTNTFTVDENTSTIRTAHVIDREVECETLSHEKLCLLEFDVGVYQLTDASDLYDLLRLVHVAVVLEDINDNSPRFPNDVVYLSVPESVSAGHSLLLSGAIDFDMTKDNGIVGYQMMPEMRTFRLNVVSGVDDINNDLAIVVQQSLDREKKAVYLMTVLAFDGGVPKRSGSVNITISVLDVNDNAPAFTRELFNVTVGEDIAVNTPILRFTAQDPDSTQNGAVSFSFTSLTSQKIKDQFAVEQATGDLILIQPLDYEHENLIQFSVAATDHGVPSMQSQAMAVVYITDVNDNFPQIDITLAPMIQSISESIDVGSFIAHVSVSDRDEGRNGEVICDISDEHFLLVKFPHFSSIYKILLKKNLDFEDATHHRVNITCCDFGNPPLQSSLVFVVDVRDENDNSPLFSKTVYYVNIQENLDPGLHVLEVMAADEDTAHNGNVTYSLKDVENADFSIDSQSGILRAIRRFDREKKAFYSLIILAQDNGTPSLSSTAVVNVNIDDVNDNPTCFPLSLFEFQVAEEQPVGTVVDTLSVIDDDNSATHQLRFSLSSDSSSERLFHVDVYTGRVTTSRILDRESAPVVHQFTVSVVDVDRHADRDVANVTVTVTDVNDNVPIITFPTIGNRTIYVTTSTPAGSIVTRILAYDVDLGDNGTAGLHFILTDGDTANMFVINGVTGELILTRRLTVIDVGSFHLRVSVQDSGFMIQLSTATHLHVFIRNDNITGLFLSGRTADYNIAIAVSLVCVTVALTLAVMTTICIIRRIDRERRHYAQAALEQSVHKQETLPPGIGWPTVIGSDYYEKILGVENGEDDVVALRNTIKLDMIKSNDERAVSDTSNTIKCANENTSGTTAMSFSTFRHNSSCCSLPDIKNNKQLHLDNRRNIDGEPNIGKQMNCDGIVGEEKLFDVMSTVADYAQKKNAMCPSYGTEVTLISHINDMSCRDHRVTLQTISSSSTSPRKLLSKTSNRFRPLVTYNPNISFSDDSVNANANEHQSACTSSNHSDRYISHSPVKERHVENCMHPNKNIYKKCAFSAATPRGILLNRNDVYRTRSQVTPLGGVRSDKAADFPCTISSNAIAGRNCHHTFLSYHSPPLSCHSPPLSHHSPPLSHHSPPLSYHSPPLSCHSPPLSCHSPPIPMPKELSSFDKIDDNTSRDMYSKTASLCKGKGFLMTPAEIVGDGDTQTTLTLCWSQANDSDYAYVNQSLINSGQAYSLQDMNEELLHSKISSNYSTLKASQETLVTPNLSVNQSADHSNTVNSTNCTINASDLCNEIDNLFFSNVIV